MFLEWGCGTFLGRTSMHNTLIRHWCTCKTKGLHRQSFRLLHTSTDHLSSSSAPSLPPLRLRLLPSVLSPYPLINQVVHFHPRKKNELWSSFPSSLSLSLETKHAPFFFFLPPPPTNQTHQQQTHYSVWVHLLERAVPRIGSRVLWGITKWGQHTQSHLFVLFHFSRRHISSPHQLGNRREAAGGRETRWGKGIWSKARCLIQHMKLFHHLLILFWHLIWWSVGSGGGVCVDISVCVCVYIHGGCLRW